MSFFDFNLRVARIILITTLIPASSVYTHPNHAPTPVEEITTEYTWSEHVRPIFREKCMNCHSAIGILPSEFNMTTYAGTEDRTGAKDWAYSIEEEILTKNMPPWGADPRYNSFKNHRFLTQEQIETIIEWARGGRPQGPQKDLPAPEEFLNRDWSLGEPDRVFEMPEAHVLSVDVTDSQVDYVFPVNFEGEENWITAIEFLPANPTIVHTMIAFIHDPVSESTYTLDMEVLTEYDPMADVKKLKELYKKAFPSGTHFLGQWVRGDAPFTLPMNVGRLLRKGSTIGLKVYYHRDSYDTIGEQSHDKSKFGIHFADGNIQKVSDSLIIRKEPFVVPVNESNYEVRESTTLTESAYLYGAYPHAGLLAKDLEILAHYPDGRSTTLLLIPAFEYKFNQSYVFEKPIFVPADIRLELIAHYDNSPENWDNPVVLPKDLHGPRQQHLFTYIDYYAAGKIHIAKDE